MAEAPGPKDEGSPTEDDFLLTVSRLQGLQHGIAALLMPVEQGWRVHYFSRPTFDTEPGEDYATFDEAVSAIAEVLPAVNTPEERERARSELREYLRDMGERSLDDHPVN